MGNNYIYTAIAGGKDAPLKFNSNIRGNNDSFYLFYDDSSVRKEARWAWNPFLMSKEVMQIKDPVRRAKYYKAMAHKVFPNAPYSLWIDGNVIPLVKIDNLIKKYLQEDDLCMFKHPLRDSAYEEAEVCKKLKLDDPAIIDAQMQRYRDNFFPEHFGLTACTVILRRHTPEVAAFNEMWWDEICKGSKRDQLSVDYCMRAYDLICNYFDGFVQGPDRNPKFEGSKEFAYFPHLK